MIATQKTTQQPEIAPHGFYFYLVTTPSPTDKGRRYLHSIHHPDKPFGEAHVTVSSTRELAKAFDRLTLALAYTDYLNKLGGLAEFSIVLETGRVLDGPSVRRLRNAEK